MMSGIVIAVGLLYYYNIDSSHIYNVPKRCYRWMRFMSEIEVSKIYIFVNEV